ncbi:hypothetical protein V1478_008416 [Vespula squamosa]|uniref:Uncharacterized protein n=1 Tax=Vespula squamosa TaxID=30214 RepID=A0ABD2ATF5_VESSQ
MHNVERLNLILNIKQIVNTKWIFINIMPVMHAYFIAVNFKDYYIYVSKIFTDEASTKKKKLKKKNKKNNPSFDVYFPYLIW